MRRFVILPVLALVAAVVPLPAAAVERAYSTGFYLTLQNVVTPVTNLVPFALFDAAAGVLLVAWAGRFVIALRSTSVRAALSGAVRQLVLAGAAAYLLFLLMWGLNYRRVPLENKLDYDADRLTLESRVQFASIAAIQANAWYAAATAAPHDDDALARAFAEAQRILGARRLASTGVPKPSLLEYYFRRAAIDGLTDPFFLEIIVNPDLLPSERPFVLAHEWAHLAGYADESEANFVAWLTGLRADAPARYSGWVAAYQHASRGISQADRARVARLDEGPRQDIRAIAARYRRSSPVVRSAARDVYDSYLRANRVAEGIDSYDAVLRLMIGSEFDAGWTPRLRSP